MPLQFTLVGKAFVIYYIPHWIKFDIIPARKLPYRNTQIQQGVLHEQIHSAGHMGHRPHGASCGQCRVPITWSFYETAITSCNSPRDCVLPPQPFVLMTLALPGPTSTG